jgi:hypothetical protein
MKHDEKKRHNRRSAMFAEFRNANQAVAAAPPRRRCIAEIRRSILTELSHKLRK